jgi:hypothetical protein
MVADPCGANPLPTSYVKQGLGATVTVPPSTSAAIQAAINGAQTGDTIHLSYGMQYFPIRILLVYFFQFSFIFQ